MPEQIPEAMPDLSTHSACQPPRPHLSQLLLVENPECRMRAYLPEVENQGLSAFLCRGRISQGLICQFLGRQDADIR